MNDLIFLLALSLFLGVLIGYSGNIQTATKWVGKKLFLDPKLYLNGPIKGNPIQWQTFVTPPSQTALNLLQIISFAGIVALFWAVKWYFVIMAFALVLVTSVVAKKFFPKKLYWYVAQILENLSKKEQMMAKEGKVDAKLLLGECRVVVTRLVEETRKTGLLILDKSLD
jgi:hypothetical protein